LDKFRFITPQEFTFEPQNDSPEPEAENTEAWDLPESGTPTDMLDNLLDLDLDHGPIDYRDIFAFEFKNNSRRYSCPRTPSRKCKLAS
jgi:hypothetical protein